MGVASRARPRQYNRRMSAPGIFRPPTAVNEPISSFAPGTPERAALQARLGEMSTERVHIPMVIGGERVETGTTFEAVMPHRRPHVLAHRQGGVLGLGVGVLADDGQLAGLDPRDPLLAPGLVALGFGRVVADDVADGGIAVAEADFLDAQVVPDLPVAARAGEHRLGLGHPGAGLAVDVVPAYEIVVDEGRHGVEIRATHSLGRLDRCARREDGKAREHIASAVVTPICSTLHSRP